MAQKVYLTNEQIGLGCFSLPVLEFAERNEILKQTNPQLNELERAAVVYFAMQAEQPKPTTNEPVSFVDWQNTSVYKDGYLTPIEKWEERERGARYRSFGDVLVPFKKENAQTAYFNALANLQKWIAYNGLWEGIEKTLSEESRKRQSELASLQASNAAAAYARAMAEKNAATSETAQREAAEKIGQAQEQLKKNLEREEQLKKELADIAAGILPVTSNGLNWVMIGAAGILLYLVIKKRGRK